MTTGPLDFLGSRPIPLSAFSRLCPGAGSRPSPVVAQGYVTHYQCAGCGAKFERAIVGDVTAPVAPAHEPVAMKTS